MRIFSHHSENGLRKVRRISYYTKEAFTLQLLSYLPNLPYR